LINPAFAQTVFTPPSNITHNTSCLDSNVQESTALFNTWLQKTVLPAAKPGDIIRLASKQCYWVDGELQFSGFRYANSGPGLTFEGNGSTFQSFDDVFETNLPHFMIQGDQNVTVQGLNIVGNGGTYNASYAFQAGFKIYGGNNVTLNNDTVNTVYGDYVWLQTDSGTVPTNVTIENGTYGGNGSGITGAGRQLLTIDDGANVTVSGNYFGHGNRSGIDIEPNGSSDTVSNVIIESNTFGPVKSYWFANKGADGKITSLTFAFNTLTGQSMNVESYNPTPTDGFRSQYQFIDNISNTGSSGCSAQGGQMGFTGVTGLEITGNTQPIGACGYLVSATDVTNYSDGSQSNVTSNTLNGATHTGTFNSSDQVCEGGNTIPPLNPPTYLASIDPFASLCPGFTG